MARNKGGIEEDIHYGDDFDPESPVRKPSEFGQRPKFKLGMRPAQEESEPEKPTLVLKERPGLKKKPGFFKMKPPEDIADEPKKEVKEESRFGRGMEDADKELSISGSAFGQKKLGRSKGFGGGRKLNLSKPDDDEEEEIIEKPSQKQFSFEDSKPKLQPMSDNSSRFGRFNNNEDLEDKEDESFHARPKLFKATPSKFNIDTPSFDDNDDEPVKARPKLFKSPAKFNIDNSNLDDDEDGPIKARPKLFKAPPSKFNIDTPSFEDKEEDIKGRPKLFRATPAKFNIDNSNQDDYEEEPIKPKSKMFKAPPAKFNIDNSNLDDYEEEPPKAKPKLFKAPPAKFSLESTKFSPRMDIISEKPESKIDKFSERKFERKSDLDSFEFPERKIEKKEIKDPYEFPDRKIEKKDTIDSYEFPDRKIEKKVTIDPSDSKERKIEKKFTVEPASIIDKKETLKSEKSFSKKAEKPELKRGFSMIFQDREQHQKLEKVYHELHTLITKNRHEMITQLEQAETEIFILKNVIQEDIHNRPKVRGFVKRANFLQIIKSFQSGFSFINEETLIQLLNVLGSYQEYSERVNYHKVLLSFTRLTTKFNPKTGKFIPAKERVSFFP